jgi:hypothetical protein
MPYRTSDLCRVIALKPVLAHPGVSENCAVLQVFYEICLGNSSTPSASILARLQYGCSNFLTSQRNEHTTKVLYNEPDDTAVHGRGIVAAGGARDWSRGTQTEDGLEPQEAGVARRA